MGLCFFLGMHLDFFDRKILDVLNRRRGSVTLAELVRDSGFARSTVIIHLERLGTEGLILKEKGPVKAAEGLSFSTAPHTFPSLKRLLSRTSLLWSFRGSKRLAGTRRAVTANLREIDA